MESVPVRMMGETTPFCFFRLRLKGLVIFHFQIEKRIVVWGRGIEYMYRNFNVSHQREHSAKDFPLLVMCPHPQNLYCLEVL